MFSVSRPTHGADAMTLPRMTFLSFTSINPSRLFHPRSPESGGEGFRVCLRRIWGFFPGGAGVIRRTMAHADDVCENHWGKKTITMCDHCEKCGIVGGGGERKVEATAWQNISCIKHVSLPSIHNFPDSGIHSEQHRRHRPFIFSSWSTMTVGQMTSLRRHCGARFCPTWFTSSEFGCLLFVY